jgi:HEPN domain-containing protein
MNYYNLSEEPLESAQLLMTVGKLRMSISMSTLAIDMLLKSVLFRLDPASDLMTGHDHIGIFRELERKYPCADLRPIVKLSRKYFNTSRYSKSDYLSLFTEGLAEKFLEYALRVKEYVDTDCQATLEELQKKFGKEY